jgi:hypothetical protein
MIYKAKMIMLKIFFIPIWVYIVIFAILMYLYDIAAGNKPRQSFKDLILELLEYWKL